MHIHMQLSIPLAMGSANYKSFLLTLLQAELFFYSSCSSFIFCCWSADLHFMIAVGEVRGKMNYMARL